MQIDFDQILEKFKGDRQMLYVTGLILGIFVAIFIVYQVFFAGKIKQQPVDSAGGGVSVPNVTFIDQLKKDLGVLSDPIFKNLKLPVELPIKIGPKGRDNPFSPF